MFDISKAQVVKVENGAIILRLQIENAATLYRALEGYSLGLPLPEDPEFLSKLELFVGLLKGHIIVAASQMETRSEDLKLIEKWVRALGITP